MENDTEMEALILITQINIETNIRGYLRNLIVDVCDVSLKVRLQVTAVATVTALVFLQLKQEGHELGLMAGTVINIG